jgi:hypothetical protein
MHCYYCLNFSQNVDSYLHKVWPRMYSGCKTANMVDLLGFLVHNVERSHKINDILNE